MFAFEVSQDIAAPPERVWAILTDAAALQQGFGILRIDGVIAAGAKVAVVSEVNPNRPFPVRVTTFAPPHSMVWTGGMPLGLFRGQRRFTLTPNRHGVTFHMREEFSGLLSGLIRRSMPDLTPSFITFATALKRKAEI